MRLRNSFFTAILIPFLPPMTQDEREDDLNNSGSNVSISAQKTFRMLNAVIDTKGDLLEEKKPW